MPNYIRRISKLKNGANFYKLDMHVHTPSSKDQHYITQAECAPFNFIEKKKLIKLFPKRDEFDKEVNKVAEKFVERFKHHGLNLVVFTDHNTPSFIDNDDWKKGTWYEAVKRAIKKAEDDGEIEKKSIKLLPGIELTTARVHILMVFDDLNEKDEEDDLVPFKISNFLNEIGFEANEVGEYVSHTGGRSVYHALNLLLEYGGIPVIAHIDGTGRSFSQSEFEYTKEKDEGGQQAVNFEYKTELEAIISISELAVLEYVEETAKIIENSQKSETWMEALTEMRNEMKNKYGKTGVKPELSFVRNSDAHYFKDIAKRFSYVKMEDLSYKSFFYALHEPKYRIYSDAKGKPVEPKYQVDGIAIIGDFLDSAVHRFNPWFNCLLGSVSSGKTTRIHVIGQAIKQLTGSKEKFDKSEGEVCFLTLRVNNNGNQSLWVLKTELKDSKTTYRKLANSYNQLGSWQESKPDELKDFKVEFILGSKIKDKIKALEIYDPPLADQCWSVIEKRINDSKNSPLIIDELEDCLTDEIIENKLIPLFEEHRNNRQIIIASSKSNIPVILDAENIIIVNKKKTLASGSLECKEIFPLLLKLIEGGEKTHHEKLRRYGHLLKFKK